MSTIQERLRQGKTDVRNKIQGEIKYGIFFAVAALFLLIVMLPAPQSLIDLVDTVEPPGYALSGGASTITENVSAMLGKTLSPEEVADKAKIMVAVLFATALLWATEAIPIAATDLLVGALLYLFVILPMDQISKAYMKDAVFFIFGILTIAFGVSKVKLDRIIGVLLLGRIRSLGAFCFIFFPLLGVIAGFFSAHALTAIIVPILMNVYRRVLEENGLKEDRKLAVLLILGVCFVINQGGPGSPAAGGRNAIMAGYFQEYGVPISFSEWILYAMPFVLIVSLAVGAFFFFVFRRKLKVRNVDFSKYVSEYRISFRDMDSKQKIMAAILIGVVILWITTSKRFGLGGPSIFAVVLMFIFGIVNPKEVQHNVRIDIVGLYAAACAMGVGLKITGASLWLAQSVINLLPASLIQGDGIVVVIALFTTVLTNFMSDGATVAAVGPVALSMASLSQISMWKTGLACAFASSFANMTIVGTPNNAIAYVGAQDAESGKKHITIRDFLIYGLPITLIAVTILCLAAFFGYWPLLPWK